MRINEIRIQNFKGFKELTETFDPNFTVFVGENGSGKTSMLEAVAASLFSWHLGMGIHVMADLSGVRIGSRVIGSTIEFSEEMPMVIEVCATSSGKTLGWKFFDDRKQSLSAESYDNQLYKLFQELRKRRESGEYLFDTWPLLAFYSAERGRGEVQKLNWNAIFGENPKRTDAYKEWKSDTSLVTQFTAWLGREEAIAFQENAETSASRTVKQAVLSCLPGSKELRFSVKHGEPIVIWNDGSAVSFSNLSHGQKSILAMIGDIARRCAMVNPHLETDAPTKTPGIVLIDELDLHLHPRWQRRIVDDLKRTFPEIQFITTTHSPFIIQALEPGELRVLGGEEPKIEYANRGIEEIARYIQGVDMPETSERFAKQKEAAKAYFQMLRDGRDEDDPELVAAKSKLTRLTNSYADNPGLSAIIEMEEEAALPSVLVREDPKPYAAG